MEWIKKLNPRQVFLIVSFYLVLEGTREWVKEQLVNEPQIILWFFIYWWIKLAPNSLILFFKKNEGIFFSSVVDIIYQTTP